MSHHEKHLQLENSQLFNAKDSAELIVSALPKVGILARDFVQEEYEQTKADLNPEADLRREQNPDLNEDHSEKWHQFGIIGHSQRFVELLDFKHAVISRVLKDLGFHPQIEQHFSQEVDGIKKSDLLLIAGALHDVMKFASPPNQQKPQYRDHSGHEERGELFIMQSQPLRRWLRECFDLTDAHVDYIARCVGLHFELGKLRRLATREGLFDYNLAYAKSDQCSQDCATILSANPEYGVEIGYLFLIDTLAKVDLYPNEADNDEQLASQAAVIKAEIAKRNLHPDLVEAVMQTPINIAVTKSYFQQLFSSNPP